MAFIGRPNLQEGMYAKLIDLIGRRPNLLAQGVRELGDVMGAYVGSRFDRDRAEQLRQQIAGDRYGQDVVGMIEKDRLGPPISRAASDSIPTAAGGVSLADLQAAIGGTSPTQTRNEVYKSMVGTMGPTTMDLAKARSYKGDIGEARKILPDEDKTNRKAMRETDLEIKKVMLAAAKERAKNKPAGGKVNPRLLENLNSSERLLLTQLKDSLDAADQMRIQSQILEIRQAKKDLFGQEGVDFKATTSIEDIWNK